MCLARSKRTAEGVPLQDRVSMGTQRPPLRKPCGHTEARDCRTLLRQVLVKWCLELRGAFVDSVCTDWSRRFAQASGEQQMLLLEIRGWREVVESGMQALHRQAVGPL